MMMKELRVPWLHASFVDAALLQLDCMCADQPYRHHAGLDDLQECARQIAAVVYKVARTGEQGADAGGRAAAFRSVGPRSLKVSPPRGLPRPVRAASADACARRGPQGRLAGSGRPLIDVAALEDAERLATRKQRGADAPPVALAMGNSLVRVLPKEQEEVVWRAQAHTMSEATLGRAAALIDERGRDVPASVFQPPARGTHRL